MKGSRKRCNNIDITVFLAVIKQKSINEINSSVPAAFRSDSVMEVNVLCRGAEHAG